MSPFLTCRPLLLCGGLFFTVAPLQAQSGADAIKKVANAYATLNTYESASSLDGRILSNGKTLQNTGNTISLKFKQPNKINLQITTNSGTINIASDGKDLILYDARSNSYLKIPAPSDGKRLLQEIALRTGVTAFMDPLFFLTKFPVPPSVGSLTVKGNETYNGHPCTIITGVEKNGNTLVRNWKWWVDRDNSMLRKIEGISPPKPVKFVRTEGKKTVEQTLPISQMTRHIVAELKVNPPLTDEIFRFVVPPNAIPKKSLDELLKGK